MRILIIGAAGLFVAACGDSSPPTPIEPVPAAAQITSPEPEAVTAAPHELWIANITPDEAALFFAPPASDYIGFTMRCKTGSAHASIEVPNFGKSLIELASGSDRQSFPSKIVVSESEDTVATLDDAALDSPLFRSFLASGQLKANEPPRDLSAKTDEEKAAIRSFFAACNTR